MRTTKIILPYAIPNLSQRLLASASLISAKSLSPPNSSSLTAIFIICFNFIVGVVNFNRDNKPLALPKEEDRAKGKEVINDCILLHIVKKLPVFAADWSSIFIQVAWRCVAHLHFMWSIQRCYALMIN